MNHKTIVGGQPQKRVRWSSNVLMVSEPCVIISCCLVFSLEHVSLSTGWDLHIFLKRLLAASAGLFRNSGSGIGY